MGRELESASRLRDASLPVVGEVVAGKYAIERLLARGGMGAVFAARHVVTDKRVALKWLLADPESDAQGSLRLIREAKAAARVVHENVVDVYDVGEHAGALFLVMEHLQGHTLAERLALGRDASAHSDEAGNQHGNKKLPLAEALSLLLPVMRGVAAAHRQGVIHRDLKPSNIFLCVDASTQSVVPRVLDFGISKVTARSSDPELSTTRPGAFQGTPYYMSPEQLAGSAALDQRTDIYSLGVILYQALAGQLPFRSQSVAGLAMLVATVDPPALAKLRPDLPVGVARVVAKAMARAASHRYESIDALIEALQVAARSRSGRSRRLRLLGVALALVLVLGSMAVLAAWRVRTPVEAAASSRRPGEKLSRPPAAAAPAATAAAAAAPAPPANTPPQAVAAPPLMAATPAAPPTPAARRPQPAAEPAHAGPARLIGHRTHEPATPSAGAPGTTSPRVSIDQFY